MHPPTDPAIAPTVAVVVPAHRASDELRRCLAGLQHCAPEPDELVVVVDGADPATVALARGFAGEVVTLDVAGGPARARNAGVAATDTDLVFFVDSDVVVPPTAIAQLRARFAAEPGVDALIGSYDADPPAPGLVSQYKNLLNHHTHQTARTEAATFWGACGAVRRTAFDGVGGFDETYTRPCVEDIELGYRLRNAGYRIRVDKDLQVTHLKQWTPRSMIRADVLDRAVPWSELLLTGRGFHDDLNISRSQRAKTVLATTGLACALLGLRWRPPRRVALGSVAALVVADLPLLRFFARARGVGFAAGAAPWHWLSYVYSAGAFATVLARLRLGARFRR